MSKYLYIICYNLTITEEKAKCSVNTFLRLLGTKLHSMTGFGQQNGGWLSPSLCTEPPVGSSISFPSAQYRGHWGPGQRSLGRTYLWVLEDLLERWRLALAHSAGKDTGGRNLREYPLAWTLPKVAILAWRPSPTYLTARKLQCWDTSGQTTNGMGTQPNSSADRLPEAILIPQPPLNSL